MLKQSLLQQFEQGNMGLFDFELAYAEKHDILPVNATSRTLQFDVLELCNKETEELISVQSVSFLQTPLQYFRQHEEQFLYTESTDFATIRVDAIAIEFDDMFKTYTALFGLKLQKKYEKALRAQLDAILPAKYSLSFDSGDGLWEVNIYLEQEDGNITLEQIMNKIYRLIFECIEAVEEA